MLLSSSSHAYRPQLPNSHTITVIQFLNDYRVALKIYSHEIKLFNAAYLLVASPKDMEAESGVSARCSRFPCSHHWQCQVAVALEVGPCDASAGDAVADDDADYCHLQYYYYSMQNCHLSRQ